MNAITKRNAGKLMLSSALLGASAARAQSGYPSRPIRLVVPFPAGSGTDEFARRFAPRIGGGIGERMIIDNRAGGNTLMATEFVAHAPPDGYTVLLQTTNFTVNPVLHSRLSFDTLRDFVPLSLVVRVPHLLAVNKDLPMRSVEELVAHAKTHPGALNFGSSGIGTTNHLAAALFMKSADIRMEHVPYRGAAEYTNDLLGGRIQLVFMGSTQGIPLSQAGTLRALAVTGQNRMRDIPEVPTMLELGYAVEIYSWFGMLVPIGTPAPIVEKLSTELQRTSRDPVLAEQMPTGQFIGSTPQEFAEFLRTDLDRTRELLRSLDLGVTVRN